MPPIEAGGAALGFEEAVAMAFTVTGRSGQGLSLIACETVVRALERAADLLRRGYVDVLIADARGGQFTPDQFTRFYSM